jgi:hypothetical protein
MTTLANLNNMLVNEYECPESDLNKILSYISENGTGIYSISHEYNIYGIMQENFKSLSEMRDTLNAEENEGWDEEDQYDIFEDFNDGDPDMTGFLFGETFFSVNITELSE